MTDANEPLADQTEPVVVALPSTGGTFKALFLDGQLHLRSPTGVEMITPVALPNGASVQFNGSHAADRLRSDPSWSPFTATL